MMPKPKRTADDYYSHAAKEKLKLRYPDLTYTAYLFLHSAYELADKEIREMYEVSMGDFRYFRDNHREVLKEKRQWA